MTIVYGARTVGDLVYKRELDEWGKRSDINSLPSVDPGGETPDWKGKVGFVPTVGRRGRSSGRGRLRRDLRAANHDQVHARRC